MFLQNNIYTFKLFYEYSIFAYYNNVHCIKDEINSILNHSNDSTINNNLLNNMKFYKMVLKPSKTIHLDDKFRSTIINEKVEFFSSSSCLIPNPNTDGYIMNLRYVNYYYNLHLHICLKISF